MSSMYSVYRFRNGSRNVVLGKITSLDDACDKALEFQRKDPDPSAEYIVIIEGEPPSRAPARQQSPTRTVTVNSNRGVVQSNTVIPRPYVVFRFLGGARGGSQGVYTTLLEAYKRALALHRQDARPEADYRIRGPALRSDLYA
ncbi:MAG TPA: hypothetical protein VJO13_14990, partial [Ktedonobacterales bacterium]|nr:hypothetical protein [Ktedonobacterales bacterium]